MFCAEGVTRKDSLFQEPLWVLGLFFFFTAGMAFAQQPPDLLLHGLQARALVIELRARVIEQNQNVIWNEAHTRLTFPGNPVGLRLVGANIIVAVQFTPFIRRGGNVMVAQGQVWIDVPDEGLKYHTSIQTVPVNFNEPIYFFPLGQANLMDDAVIEIMLIMKPYGDTQPGASDGG